MKPAGVDWLVLHPLFLGPAILTLNTTAYTAEIFYGALMTVPKGEIEAAKAYGMSRAQIFRSVTWPHLIRIAWPAYTNEVVFLFHATALVYFTLPVIDEQKDLMNMAGSCSSATTTPSSTSRWRRAISSPSRSPSSSFRADPCPAHDTCHRPRVRFAPRWLG